MIFTKDVHNVNASWFKVFGVIDPAVLLPASAAARPCPFPALPLHAEGAFPLPGRCHRPHPLPHLREPPLVVTHPREVQYRVLRGHPHVPVNLRIVIDQMARTGNCWRRLCRCGRECVRQVISRIEVRHVERPMGKLRASRLLGVEIVPASEAVTAFSSPTDFTNESQPGLPFHIESMFLALLTRTICPENKAKRTQSDIVRNLRAQGKRPCDIARELGMTARDVNKVLYRTVNG